MCLLSKKINKEIFASLIPKSALLPGSRIYQLHFLSEVRPPLPPKKGSLRYDTKLHEASALERVIIIKLQFSKSVETSVFQEYSQVRGQLSVIFSSGQKSLTVSSTYFTLPPIRTILCHADGLADIYIYQPLHSDRI